MYLGFLFLVAAPFVLRALLTWIPRRWNRTRPNRRHSLANVLTRPFSLVEWLVKIYPRRFQPDAPDFMPEAWTRYPHGVNCYAYALNMDPVRWGLERTWSELGDAASRYAGRPIPAATWREVRRVLRMEGLRPATLLTLRQPPGGRWLVAVLLDPRTVEFHVLRLDRDGRWSHKPGRDEVTRLDSRGTVIRTPRRAVFAHTYWFCGYFWVDPQTNLVRRGTYAQACIAARMAGVEDPVY